MQYRLFLYDSANRIRAAEAYIARSDHEAMEIGAAVQSASSDQFGRFEVWQGIRWLKDIGRQGQPTMIDLIDKHADIVVEVEERLNHSFACIKRSRNLMETLDRLQEKRWHPPRQSSAGRPGGK